MEKYNGEKVKAVYVGLGEDKPARMFVPKIEFAREIFADIYDRLLTSFPPQSFIDAPCRTHDRIFDMIAELEKKYTEEKE